MALEMKPISPRVDPGQSQENNIPKPGQEWFWTEAWQKAEREAEADLAAGIYETFDSMEDFLKGLK
jgi:hypothetical protein